MKRISKSLRNDHTRFQNESTPRRERLEQRLANVGRRMDQAYSDKLDGKIPEDFWQRKMSEWRQEEQEIQSAITGLKDTNADRVLTVERCL